MPWDDAIDVIKFPSHTSIISQDLLLEKLNENGIEVDFDLFKGKKIEVPATQSAKDFSAFRKFKLDAEFDTGLPEGQTPLNRLLFDHYKKTNPIEIIAIQMNSIDFFIIGSLQKDKFP